MNPRILLVDDEPNVLSGLRRNLHGRFQVETAGGGAEGLEKLGDGTGFGVVLSDMRMPGMDGVEFLSSVRTRAPDVVRLMLTGNADQATAVEAVNRGAIFRFLNKPCAPEAVVAALSDGLAQHRLLTAERELVERTLGGTVGVLVEVLMAVDPAGFGRAMRVRGLARRVTSAVPGLNTWELDLAAMLHPLGATALPAELREKLHAGTPLEEAERVQTARTPTIGADMIAKIPRLAGVAEIVRHHRAAAAPNVPAGARVLRVLTDFSALAEKGLATGLVFARLGQESGDVYDPAIFAAVRDALLADEGATEAQITSKRIAELYPGLVLVDDIAIAADGGVLLKAGFEISETLLSKIRAYHQFRALREPVRVVHRH